MSFNHQSGLFLFFTLPLWVTPPLSLPPTPSSLQTCFLQLEGCDRGGGLVSKVKVTPSACSVETPPTGRICSQQRQYTQKPRDRQENKVEALRGRICEDVCLHYISDRFHVNRLQRWRSFWLGAGHETALIGRFWPLWLFVDSAIFADLHANGPQRCISNA